MTNSNNENSGKKFGAFVLGGIALLAVGAAALYLIDVDQTKEARLPTVDVNVSAESGQMPAFDVDVADVDVGMKETTVTVPGVDVETKTIEIEVPVDANVEGKEVGVKIPTIDVDKPKEDDPADNPT